MIYPLLETAEGFFPVGRERWNLIILIQTWTEESQASIIVLVNSLYLSDFAPNEQLKISLSLGAKSER